jgi:hypothetical protein
LQDFYYEITRCQPKGKKKKMQKGQAASGNFISHKLV